MRWTPTRRALATATLVLALASVRARAEAAPNDNPVERHLVAPEVILGHAQELGLDETQRKALRNELMNAQRQSLEPQLAMGEEMETLDKLLAAHPIDEGKVLAELDRVLALEKQVKRVQVTLLVRLKNLLTPAQQERLEQIRRAGG
jgi:Spy/CpxP family protein refolding chaperone